MSKPDILADSFLMVTDHLDENALPVMVDRDHPCEKTGASHHYTATTNGNPCIDVQFQHGARDEDGSTPGASNEALVAIVIDRLRGFQSGPFRCRENAIALTKLEESLHWMQARARSREARGVLGTHNP